MYVPQCGKVCIEEICIGRRCASAGMHVKHAVCISINATAAHAAPKLRRAHSRCIPSGDWDTLIRTGGVVPEETFMLPCSPVMAHTIEVPPRMAVQLSRRKGSFFYWPLGLWPLFPRQVATAPPKLTGRLRSLHGQFFCGESRGPTQCGEIPTVRGVQLAPTLVQFQPGARPIGRPRGRPGKVHSGHCAACAVATTLDENKQQHPILCMSTFHSFHCTRPADRRGCRRSTPGAAR